MIAPQRSKEQGQVLVMIVLAMVALLGFTALAVDGGMLYADRRFSQNGADASSLAGVGVIGLNLDNAHVTYQSWSCGNGSVISAMQAGRNAAVARAASNDFTIDQDVSDQHGVVTQCTIDDNGSWKDKFIEVTTQITYDTQLTFAQFVTNGPLRNTVTAKARVRPRSPLAFGNAIVALREDCPNTNTGGVHFDGTNAVSVTGGGIFSNACMRANGSVQVDIYGGYNFTCTGENCLTTDGGPSLNAHDGGQFVEGNQQLPPDAYYIPPPDCGSVPNQGNHSGGGTISPGNYSGITVNGNDELTMQPGLYCLSGNFRANGGTITGTGVTIYLTSGDFDTSGNVHINLVAPPARTCAYCPPPIPGVLIYLAHGNSGEVSLLGTSDSEYLGVVYAPNGMIEAGGTGSELSEIHAQLIGDTVKIHGTASVIINFDGDENYNIPPLLELSK
jgi:hypothetical protein